MEEVVLVDEQDRVVATEEKLRAHRDGGKLHRAFSIMICDPRGRMLLQLRSRKKYHFGGLGPTPAAAIRGRVSPWTRPPTAACARSWASTRLCARSSRLSTVWKTLGAA